MPVGALEDTSKRIYAPYMVMVNPYTDRPKYGGTWATPTYGSYGPNWSDIEAEMKKDRALYATGSQKFTRR